MLIADHPDPPFPPSRAHPRATASASPATPKRGISSKAPNGSDALGGGRPASPFNYARAVVRKTAAYVFPAPVTFTIPAEGDDATANAAEQMLGRPHRRARSGPPRCRLLHRSLHPGRCGGESHLGCRAAAAGGRAGRSRHPGGEHRAGQSAPHARSHPGLCAGGTGRRCPLRSSPRLASARPARARRRNLERRPLAGRDRRADRPRRAESLRLDSLRDPAERHRPLPARSGSGAKAT